MAADAVYGNMSFQLLHDGLLFILLTAATYSDLQRRIIPDSLCLAVALTGLLSFTPGKLLGPLVALPLLFAALHWGGMGGGDIKLTAAMGAALGFSPALAALILGLSSQLLFYLMHHLSYGLLGRKRPHFSRTAYPLAPFLTVGCLAVYFI